MKTVRCIYWILLIALFFLISCKNQSNLERAADPLTPIQLLPDTTVILLGDYVSKPEDIKRVICPDGFGCKLKEDSKELQVVPTSEGARLGFIRLCAEKDTIDLLLKKSLKKKVELTYSTEMQHRTVHIAGEMNAWNDLASPMQQNDQIWSASFWLLPGKYPYLMVLDGRRDLDKNNPTKESNGMGGFNSVLQVEGPSEQELPFIFTSSHKGDLIQIGAESGPLHVLAFWQNTCILSQDSIVDSFELRIPKNAKSFERSWIRIYAENEAGYSNDILIPLHRDKVLSQSASFSRSDFHTQVMYFLMVDRFFDGNSANNRPTPDESIHPRANFHGGDIAGVLEKLKEGYFEQLGINTIWLSPIPRNPEGAYGLWDKGGVRSTFSSYHGYWPTGLSAVDDRFGTSEELKALIQEAHSRNINIILDFVAHHIHEEHPLYKEKKSANWFTDLYLPDGSLNTERWDDHRLTTWFDVFLPTFNFDNQAVCDMLSDSALYWLDAYSIDGFRHDATKHIDLRFWRTLTRKVNDYKLRSGNAVYQVGETYGSPELIASYVQSGLLDAQFDFNVYDAAIAALCNEDVGFDQLVFRLKQSQQYYGSHHLMGNMSGNQDKNRFMALASGDVRFDEDGKLAGWTRAVEKRTDEGFKRLELMHAINLTIPGVPCIYYGDDIGLTGGNDPDNRRMMKFNGLEKEEQTLLNNVAMLSRLRRSLPALSYGSLKILNSGDPDLLIFERRYFDQVLQIVINKSSEAKALKNILRPDKAIKIHRAHCCPANESIDALSWNIYEYKQ